MFAHYVRMLLRKQPAFTAINLAGLVLGMSACLLILKWINDTQKYIQNRVCRIALGRQHLVILRHSDKI